MFLQPDTYRLLIYVATLGLTLIAGFLLGILTNNRQPGK